MILNIDGIYMSLFDKRTGVFKGYIIWLRIYFLLIWIIEQLLQDSC